jgi:uncharacterized protein (DUF58 family)
VTFTERRDGWRRTDALVRAVVCGLGLLVAGLVLHRLELVLIGMPLVVGLLLVPRPTGVPAVVPGEPADATVGLAVTPGEGAVLAALRVPVPGRTGVGPVHLLPAVHGEVRAEITWPPFGRVTYLRPDHLFASHDGLYVYGPVVGAEAHRTVLPAVEALPPGPLPPRAAGLVGTHRSPRPGDGMELRDIRPFRSGDRLRRVDWRVSLRAAAAAGVPLGSATLHVRERHAEADADLVLVLDTRLDVGRAVEEWNTRPVGVAVRPGGSLDVGVRAASTLAAAFLRQGDRVGLVDLGHPRRGVPVGSGQRQLRRIRYQLTYAVRRTVSGNPVLAQAQLPPGATVLVLSPFLDDQLVELVARLTRRGRLVVAVDLLPTELTADRTTPWGPAVASILRAEHRVRVRALEEHGVTVLKWDTGAPVADLLRRAVRRRRS